MEFDKSVLQHYLSKRVRKEQGMHIKDMAQKGNFKNEHHKLRVNLLYSAYWFTDKMTQFLKPFGITQQQFNALRILRGQSPDPISTKELRERMIIGNSDTSRLVDRLCEKGLVWKRPCPHDGRLIQAFIHDKGLTLLEEIDKHITDLDGVMKNLTKDEAKTLNNLLIKMRNID